ncbi:MAG: DUF732 domain-containing protein [Mycobacterium sp.]
MFTTRIAKIAATAVASTAFGLAAFAGTGTASAGSIDDQFITNITGEGISFTSESAAIREARTVCTYLSAGQTGVDLVGEIQSNSDLTTDQAAAFVVEATYAYCPSLKGQLQA